MAAKTVIVPAFKASLLQDVAIALGRVLKGIRYANAQLIFNAEYDARSGAELERMDIEAISASGMRTKLVLWEDGMAWIYHDAVKGRTRKGSLKYEKNIQIAALGHYEIAQLFNETLKSFSSTKQRWDELSKRSTGSGNMSSS